MDATNDHLVNTDVIVNRDICLSREKTNSITSNDGSILDLSQRSTTETMNSIKIITNWNNQLCSYSDSIEDDDFNKNLIINPDHKFNIEQSLTDQLKDSSIKKDSLSDNSTLTQSKIHFLSSTKKPK